MNNIEEKTVKCECEGCGSEFLGAAGSDKCSDCIEWEAENLCPMCGGDEFGSYDCGKFCKECGYYD